MSSLTRLDVAHVVLFIPVCAGWVVALWAGWPFSRGVVGAVASGFLATLVAFYSTKWAVYGTAERLEARGYL